MGRETMGMTSSEQEADRVWDRRSKEGEWGWRRLPEMEHGDRPTDTDTQTASLTRRPGSETTENRRPT